MDHKDWNSARGGRFIISGDPEFYRSAECDREHDFEAATRQLSASNL